MSNSEHQASAFMALLFAIGSVCCTIVLCSTLLTWHNAQNWAKVPARILHAEVKEGAANKGSTIYYVTAEYVYEYNGQEYTGHDVDLYGGRNGNGSPPDFYPELSEYQKTGKQFRCYVNPVRPEQALLYRDLVWSMLTLQIILVLVFSGGLWLIIAPRITFRKRRFRAATSG